MSCWKRAQMRAMSVPESVAPTVCSGSAAEEDSLVTTRVKRTPLINSFTTSAVV